MMYDVREEKSLQVLTDELLRIVEGKTDQYWRKLDVEQAREFAEKLRRVIRYHDYKYYVQASPVISDYQYDKLFKALESVEAAFPELIVPDSPTQRISPAFTGEFAKVKHLAEMTSLENTYSAEDIREWCGRVFEAVGGDVSFVVEPKFDGASMELVYENDVLVRAVTRGDGIVGEDVTANVKTIRSVPLNAPFSKYGFRLVALRGEVIMPRSVFKELNVEREKQGLPLFANPRNAAAGTIRLKNPAEVARRRLDCYVYFITYAEPKKLCQDVRTQWDVLDILVDCGFKVSLMRKLCNSVDEVIDFVMDCQSEREQWDFEADGMVIKVNDICMWDVLGETLHHPRWAVAYKFPAKQSVTRLIDVVWQVGRTGALTPVAILEPVEVGGVVVSRASLFNPDEIERKDVKIGDYVIVERAGETIPYVVGPVKERRTGSEIAIKVPDRCPVCGSRIVRELDEAVPRCSNVNCPAQLKEHLIYWGKVLDIKGIGEATADILIKENFVESISDLYYLDADRLKQLPGWADKKVENLISQIGASKQAPFYKKLAALGIRHVGEKTAMLLAERFDSILDIMNAGFDDIASISGVGPITATSVKNFFMSEQNRKMLEDLEKAGFIFAKAPEEKQGQVLPKPLEGKRVVFTGELEHFRRKEVQELVELLGGTATSSVTKKTDFVVVGSSPGSKFDKARSLGIRILNEQDFLDMLREFSLGNPQLRKLLEEKKVI